MFAATQPLLQACLRVETDATADAAERKTARPAAAGRWWLWGTALLVACVAGLLPLSRWQDKQRLAQIARDLRVPATSNVELDHGKLIVKGSARDPWIRHAQATATWHPDIEAVDLSQVVNEDQNWLRYVDRVRQLPGILVTSVSQENGHYHLEGLRDPLAKDPQTLLAEFALEPQQVVAVWKPFRSLEPTLLVEQLAQAIRPPASVTVTKQADALRLSGTANETWIAQAKATAELLTAGGIQLDLSALENIDLASLERIAARIRQQAVLHAVGSAVSGKRPRWHHAVARRGSPRVLCGGGYPSQIDSGYH